MSRALTDQLEYALDDQISQIKWHDNNIVLMNDVLKQFQAFFRHNFRIFSQKINKTKSKPTTVVKQKSDSFQKIHGLSDYAASAFVERVKNAIPGKYYEAFYSLLLVAYFQKVVNSDALVQRDYAQGRGSSDLCVTFKNHQYLIVAKIHGKHSKPESLKQLARYLDTSGEKEAWLLIFNLGEMLLCNFQNDLLEISQIYKEKLYLDD